MTDVDARRSEGSPARFEAAGPAEPIERLVSLARTVVEECRLRLTPDGLRVRATDPATVAAVDLTLSASAFDRYAADGGRVGVDLERFAGALDAAAGPSGTVDLSVGGPGRRLRVVGDDVEFALGLVDPEAVRALPDAVAPNLEDLAELVATGGTVDRGVRTAGMVADCVTLAVDPDDGEFRMTAEGDTDECVLARAGEDLPAFDPAPAESLFSVEYLRAVAAELDADAPVTLQVGTEAPLVADVAFADGDGDARFVLAPRIAR